MNDATHPNRRTLLAAACGLATATLAGCASGFLGSEGGSEEEEGRADEEDPLEDVENTACAVGTAAIEAIVDEDETWSETFFPAEKAVGENAWISLEDHPKGYDEWVVVIDDLESISCEKRIPRDGRLEIADEEFEGDVSDVMDVVFEYEFLADGERYEQPVMLEAMAIDGQWYAWIPDGMLVYPQTEVDVSRDDAAGWTRYTLEDLGLADGVSIRGGPVDSPDEHLLTDVGETVRVSFDPEEYDARDFRAYAYVGDDPANPVVERWLRK